MLAKPEQLPGWVEGLTERTALGRLGEADDVAEVIVGLLEMGWVTGQTVFADGGLALHSPIDAYGQMQRLILEGRSCRMMRRRTARECRRARPSSTTPEEAGPSRGPARSGQLVRIGRRPATRSSRAGHGQPTSQASSASMQPRRQSLQSLDGGRRERIAVTDHRPMRTCCGPGGVRRRPSLWRPDPRRARAPVEMPSAVHGPSVGGPDLADDPHAAPHSGQPRATRTRRRSDSLIAGRVHHQAVARHPEAIRPDVD